MFITIVLLPQHDQLRRVVHPAVDPHHDHVHADLPRPVAHEPPRLLSLHGRLGVVAGRSGPAATQGPTAPAGRPLPALQWPVVGSTQHDGDGVERGYGGRTGEGGTPGGLA